jgi:CRISPR-associated endonuclease/helicase Cas3
VSKYLKKDKVIFAVITKAIIAHHSLQASDCDGYKVSEEAINYLLTINNLVFSEEELTELIAENYSLFSLKESSYFSVSRYTKQINKVDHYLFYFVLVRLLRLADQRATRKLNEM